MFRKNRTNFFGLIERNLPELATKVEAVLKTWQLDQMIENGQLIGTILTEGKILRDQEGRLGYEQYPAKTMILLARATRSEAT